jgi:putative NIF3 family GTP cyclohydrolase 1 type 2
MPTTVHDLIAYIERLAGHPLNRDEGIQHGADRPITGVTVCWMASPDAIRAAGAPGMGTRGDELLIGHESLYYPYDVIHSANPPAGWEGWQVNRQRRELLAEYDLTFLRAHGSLDEICIFDDFVARLGLGASLFTDGLVKVFEIAPCPLAELVGRVKARMRMPALRVSAPAGLDQIVRRVGLPWGGLGLFVNVGYQQRLIEQGCDVFIAGESDNYGFRFAAECGIPMIETSHELSENDGLRRFTEMLAQAFPDVRCRFFENPCAWEIR